MFDYIESKLLAWYVTYKLNKLARCYMKSNCKVTMVVSGIKITCKESGDKDFSSLEVGEIRQTLEDDTSMDLNETKAQFEAARNIPAMAKELSEALVSQVPVWINARNLIVANNRLEQLADIAHEAQMKELRDLKIPAED